MDSTPQAKIMLALGYTIRYGQDYGTGQTRAWCAHIAELATPVGFPRWAPVI